MIEFLIKDANLTGLTNFLNAKFQKKHGGKFSRRDVLGYIERGYLPTYIGGNPIIQENNPNCSIKLYSVLI